MARLKGRIRRLVRQAGIEERREPDPVFRVVCDVALAARPDWALVESCDTDEATYAEFEKLRAGARGDWRRRDELNARFPHRIIPCPPEIAAGVVSGAAWISRGEHDPDRPDRMKAMERAVLAAKRRLARQAKERRPRERPCA